MGMVLLQAKEKMVGDMPERKTFVEGNLTVMFLESQILMEHLGCQLKNKNRSPLMNDIDDNKFDWGESVKVKDTAPTQFRPGQVASVCGMIKIKTKNLADKYTRNIGEWCQAAPESDPLTTLKTDPLYSIF